METVAGVTVEVVDMTAHVFHMIAHTTMTHITTTIVMGTHHHTTPSISTALARIVSMMLVASTATCQGGRARKSMR